MSITFDNVKESENVIKKLMTNIEEATHNMNQTFEETVLRHQEQFIKCYRLKIHELVKLLEELKSRIQDKFINNTLAIQLQTVIKERDYFKYECLKLNSQHQSLLDDHKTLTAQANNASEQIIIYKHLLQNEKLKSNEIETNVQQLKKNLAEISVKNMPEIKSSIENRVPECQREIVKLKKDIREKNQVIRALREKIHDMERTINLEHSQRVQKKELFEVWRVCVEGWKREVISKGKKEESKLLSLERIPNSSKKELLRTLFTHSQFLKFIERLLFDEGFKVVFQSTQENYMEKNRAKLVNYMTKRRIYTSQRMRM